MVLMKKSLGLLAVLPVAALLTACGTEPEAENQTSVVASFYPLAFVAERIGGQHVNVESLTSPGVEPHDLELKPKQVARVQKADLVMYQEGFQDAVDSAVKQAKRPADTTINSGEYADLKADDHAEEEHGHDEEGHDHEGHDHDHEGHDHDHGDLDPHMWLDPNKMIPVAEAFSAALIKASPTNAEEIQANTDRLLDDLTKVDQEYTQGLATCKTRTIVTTHAAFGYLAAAYNLKQVAIAGIDPGSEPSPSQMAEITNLVRDQNITTVFTEELVSPKNAETIAQETGAELATLDTIEGLSDETKDDDYLSLMYNNLEAIQKANSCS
jgi:zinc transport system substrate-binding protein